MSENNGKANGSAENSDVSVDQGLNRRTPEVATFTSSDQNRRYLQRRRERDFPATGTIGVVEIPKQKIDYEVALKPAEELDSEQSEQKQPSKHKVEHRSRGRRGESTEKKQDTAFPDLPRPPKARRVRELSLGQKLIKSWPLVLVLVVVVSLVVASSVWYLKEQKVDYNTDFAASVKVAGAVGGLPVVTINGKLVYSLPKTRVVVNGKGAALKPGDDVFLQISVFDSETGKLLNRNSLPRQVFGKFNEALLGADLFNAVDGYKIGSRLLIKRPVLGGNGAPHMEINVIDIMPTVNAASKLPDKLPVPYREDKGLPQIDKSDFKPADDSLTMLKVGSGVQIKASQKVIAQYGVWKNGAAKPRSYTWGKQGPEIIDLRKTYTALANELADARVGSRMLLVLPAEDAQGDAPVAVVVDVLAVANP